jgi:C1A family cysteine protease
VMTPGPQELAEWQADYLNAPVYQVAQNQLFAASIETPPIYFNLLPLLEYTPQDRDQGYAGNCWVWAGTGLMEVGLDTAQGIKERLSMQYLNSNYLYQSNRAGCGGDLTEFANFYNGYSEYWSQPAAVDHIVVPWSNTGANYQDTYFSVCNEYSNAVVATSPNYAIHDNISVQTIATAGSLSQAEAIANIKSKLLNNQAIFFGFYLPNTSSTNYGSNWNDFFDFWSNQPESSVWSPDFGCDLAWPAVGGHAVVCVGYDDRDNSWIMLNSWGTTVGRPNGLFRLTQDLDYSCTFNSDGNNYNIIQWQVLSDIYDITAPVVTIDQASVTGDENATLSGSLTDMGGNQSVTAFFEYGTDSSYGFTTAAQILSETGGFCADLSGLTMGQTYHFRIVADGDNSTETIYSPDAAFICETLSSGDPAITTLAASNTRHDSVTLNANLSNVGSDGSALVYFEYGLTEEYGSISTTLTKYSAGKYQPQYRRPICQHHLSLPGSSRGKY